MRPAVRQRTSGGHLIANLLSRRAIKGTLARLTCGDSGASYVAFPDDIGCALMIFWLGVGKLKRPRRHRVCGTE
ncbi:hypothetical protein KCP77_06415 [Salmonella enterica subsp. enterica]|nr:hypothetical protein KCP77_06415 [Salmonella enterica subsp. enterica]